MTNCFYSKRGKIKLIFFTEFYICLDIKNVHYFCNTFIYFLFFILFLCIIIIIDILCLKTVMKTIKYIYVLNNIENDNVIYLTYIVNILEKEMGLV